MANIRKQAIDKTYLSLDQAEERGFLHRDYIAHCLRWSHVCKFLQQCHRYKTTRLLDVGCGRELPLAKLLYSSRLIVEQYVGVDYGPVNEDAIEKFKGGKFPLTVHQNTDFVKMNIGHEWPTVITCFEVLEHVEPRHMLKILQEMRRYLTDDGVAFISTPCYDTKVGAADNHVNELTYEALGAIFQREGWYVHNVWGTFASIKDYKDLIEADNLGPVFDRAREYFDTNMLANIFAHRYPHRSRNCLWKLAKSPDKSAEKVHTFDKLELCKMPWGSSENWGDLAL